MVLFLLENVVERKLCHSSLKFHYFPPYALTVRVQILSFPSQFPLHCLPAASIVHATKTSSSSSFFVPSPFLLVQLYPSCYYHSLLLAVGGRCEKKSLLVSKFLMSSGLILLPVFFHFFFLAPLLVYRRNRQGLKPTNSLPFAARFNDFSFKEGMMAFPAIQHLFF